MMCPLRSILVRFCSRVESKTEFEWSRRGVPRVSKSDRFRERPVRCRYRPYTKCMRWFTPHHSEVPALLVSVLLVGARCVSPLRVAQDGPLGPFLGMPDLNDVITSRMNGLAGSSGMLPAASCSTPVTISSAYAPAPRITRLLGSRVAPAGLRRPVPIPKGLPLSSGR